MISEIKKPVKNQIAAAGLVLAAAVLFLIPAEAAAGRVAVYCNKGVLQCADPACFQYIEVDLGVWTWGKENRIPTITVHRGFEHVYDDVMGAIGRIDARAFVCTKVSRTQTGWLRMTIECTSWKKTDEVSFTPQGTFLPHRKFTVNQTYEGKLEIKE